MRVYKEEDQFTIVCEKILNTIKIKSDAREERIRTTAENSGLSLPLYSIKWEVCQENAWVLPTGWGPGLCLLMVLSQVPPLKRLIKPMQTQMQHRPQQNTEGSSFVANYGQFLG